MNWKAIIALLAVLILAGCAGGFDQPQPKQVSSVLCDITGRVDWEQLEAPDIKVTVWYDANDYDTFSAHNWPPDYMETVSVAGDRYYTIYGEYPGATVYPIGGYTNVWIDGDTGSVSDIDFEVAWDD